MTLWLSATAVIRTLSPPVSGQDRLSAESAATPRVRMVKSATTKRYRIASQGFCWPSLPSGRGMLCARWWIGQDLNRLHTLQTQTQLQGAIQDSKREDCDWTAEVITQS